MNTNIKAPELTGAVILGHGSRSGRAGEMLAEVVEIVQRACAIPIELASLQFNSPSLSEAVAVLVNRGMRRIVVMPFFLFPGNHVIQDIPAAVAAEEAKYGQVEFTVTKQLGADARLVSVVIARLREALGFDGDDVLVSSIGLAPAEIEARSFAIIEQSLPELGDGSGESEVKKRIIHASGDLAVVGLIFFAEGAISAAIEAIRAGKTIVTDVNMVKTGISRAFLKYDNLILCLIGGEEVGEKARLASKTKAATAIALAAESNPDAVFIVGNAPSALFELCGLVESGAVDPAAIIGFPVGFVGAAQSKDRLMTLDVPWIAISGTRGGSAMAAAAFNAIARLANEKIG